MANLLTHQVCTNKLYVIREKRTADLPVGFFVAVFRFEKASFVLLNHIRCSKGASADDVSVRRIIYSVDYVLFLTFCGKVG